MTRGKPDTEAKHLFGPFGRLVIEPTLGYAYGWWQPRGFTDALGPKDSRVYHLKSIYGGPAASLYLGDSDHFILTVGGKLGWGFSHTGVFGLGAKVSYAFSFGGR